MREDETLTQAIANTTPLSDAAPAASGSSPPANSSESEEEDDTDALLAKYSFNTTHKA
jgi:hypothetical protein